ncbi:MAG: class I SAM-dependent methyltransferase [Candidatus Omnitrophota bacterium]
MKSKMMKFMNISIAQLWDLVLNPWKITVLKKSPGALLPVEVIGALFPNLSIPEIKLYRLDLLRNEKLFSEINNRMVEKRQRRVICQEWDEFLYMVIRFLKPQFVLETGVFDGQSSAFILQALCDNDYGKLISVDLPAIEVIDGSTDRMSETTLPSNCSAGWVIPSYLRTRHQLILGDAKKILPDLFQEYPEIDIFFHDSLHTFEHQYFEYSIAWPHLIKGGLLISDDIFWSSAFHRFCKEKNRNYVRLKYMGAVKK